MWTTLNFGGRKRKKLAKDICRGTLDIEWERDWPVGLGGTLGDRQKIRKYFSSFRDFCGKSRQCHILGFECTINSENLIKIFGAIFEKLKILNIFLMWTTLHFGDRSKTKKLGTDICKGTPRYRMWTRLVSWLKRYVRRRTEN